MAKFFRADGSEIHLHDTEDKAWWVSRGSTLEAEFLRFCSREQLLAGIERNPAHVRGESPTTPEFVYNGRYLDLKAQAQPFFTAQRTYGIPPRYAVTLNQDDVLDVRDEYPGCGIVFWVRWQAIRYESNYAPIQIQPLHGVWLVTADELPRLVAEATTANRIHRYGRRRGDRRGNAQVSYLLDVRQLQLVWLDQASPPLD